MPSEFRAKRWVNLLNAIDHLDTNSLYMEAVFEDDEVAERMAENYDPDRPPPPGEEQPMRLRDFNAQVQALATLVELMQVNNNITAAVGGVAANKLPKFQPYARPKSKYDQIISRKRETRRKVFFDRLVSKAIGKTPLIDK